MRVLVESQIFIGEDGNGWQWIIDMQCQKPAVCYERNNEGKEMRCSAFQKQPTGVKVCNR